MKYNSDIHHRRSIRLKDYDYSQAGYYFVTICVQHKKCLFGNITDGKMRLNIAGKMIQTVWDEIPPHYPGIEIDVSIVMPNHFHGIITVGAATEGRPDYGKPQEGQPQGVAPTGLSLVDVMQPFKTMTTRRYTVGVKQYQWQPFTGKLWQRNYWEHIIRDDNDLDHIREYIQNNPAQWELDELNPHSRPIL